MSEHTVSVKDAMEQVGANNRDAMMRLRKKAGVTTEKVGRGQFYRQEDVDAMVKIKAEGKVKSARKAKANGKAKPEAASEKSEETTAVKDELEAGIPPEKPEEPRAIIRPRYSVYDDPTRIDGTLYRAGVWYHGQKETKEGPVNIDNWIASPIHIDAIASCDDEEFGRVLRFRNSLGRWRRWAMPMELLKGSGEEMRGELLRLGANIDPGHRNKLSVYIQSRHPDRTVISAQRTGWHGDDLFVLPHTTIGGDDVLFQSAAAGSGHYSTGGTLEQWQQEIAPLCALNDFLLFSVSCALAGPLFSPQHRSGAGVHFAGDSFKGKTTGACVAASIWGKAKDFVSTWRATANGLEGDAAMRNDTLMILDEMKQADPREVAAVIYMLANGSGKKRAGRTGLARPSKKWNLLVMSNGEAGADTFLKAGGLKIYAGQEVRLPTIPVTGAKYGVFDELHGATSGKVFADNLQTLSNKYYGHLGPAFVEALMESGQLANISERTQELQGHFKADGDQEARVGGNFAIIALAGELAIEFGLLPWNRWDAVHAAVSMFNLWRSNKDSGDSEDAAALRQVEAFIAKHGDSRFEHIDADDNGPVIRDRAGWWKRDGKDRVFMFTRSALEEACPGSDVGRVAKAMDDAGWLHSKSSGRLSNKTRTTTGSPRLYWILPKTDET